MVEDVEKQSIVYLTGSQGDQRVFKMVLFLNDTLALFCLYWAGGLSEEDKRRTEMCNKDISPLLNNQRTWHPRQAIAPLYVPLQERKLFYPWKEREMLSSRKEVKFCRNSVLLIDCYDSVQFHFQWTMHVKGLTAAAADTDKIENKCCRTYTLR